MSINKIKFASNLRKSRYSLGVVKGLDPRSQSYRNGQTVSVTGASRAVRPPLTAVRQMDNKGQGSVRYY